MRANDLKSPFSWDHRKPALKDNVLFVPKYYDNHKSPVKKLFTHDHPIHIEYCSGNGEWILNLAEQNPHLNYIAVEKQFPRVRKIWSKSQNRQIKNLLIVCGEALTFTRYYISKPCFSAIYINFPDPWPKTRHAKHRLIQEPFATEIARCALPGATATFTTDDLPYITQMQNVMNSNPSWSTPTLSVLDDSDGKSFFDRLWRSKNRQIYQIASFYKINT